MKLRKAAFLFGVAFLSAGLAWHFPFLFDNGLLFGIFQIGSVHNKVYLGSGLLAWAASSRFALSKLYFKLVGGLYALLGFLGLLFQDQFLAMQLNNADNIFHLLIGVIAVTLAYKLKLNSKLAVSGID